MKQGGLSCVIALILELVLAAPALAEIRIGVPASLTGGYAFTGASTRQSSELAVADLNAKGGVLGEQLQIVLADDQCGEEPAALAASKMIAEKVAAVFGHDCSGAAIPASDLYEAARLPFFTANATKPKLTDRGLKYVFRVVGRDDQQAIIAADYLIKHFGGKSVAIVHDNQVYGSGLAEAVRTELRRRGVQETIFEAVELGQVEFSELVARLRTAGVAVLYFAGYQQEGGLLIRQAWENGVKIPMLAGDGINNSDFWMIAGSDAAQATIAASGPDLSKTPEAADIISRIDDPTTFNLGYYAAIQAWAQAAEQAKTTRGDEVTKVLRAHQFNTVIGKIGFDEKGDLIGPTMWVWWTWRDGTLVPLEAAR